MDQSRRTLLVGVAGVGLLGTKDSDAKPVSTQTFKTCLNAAEEGLVPGGPNIQTKTLQAAIDKAANAGLPLFLPKGDYLVGNINLPEGLTLFSYPDQAQIFLIGQESGFFASNLNSLTLSGLSISGKKAALSEERGLINGTDLKNIRIENCQLSDSNADGLHLERSGGQIFENVIEQIEATGIFSNDSHGLDIHANMVRRCNNNGIQVWRSEKGHDGSLIRSNRIELIAAKNGGTGQNGNGINLFRSGDVIVSGNMVSDCAFSAIRANSTSNVQIQNNACTKLGETAIYAELAFDGAIISGNLIDGAVVGISATNFNEGGRLCVIQGNLVRNILKEIENRSLAIGIYAEADSTITGNTIESVRSFGILIGHGQYLRDLVVSGNLVRDADVGIGYSAQIEGCKFIISNNLLSGITGTAIQPLILSEDGYSKVDTQLQEGQQIVINNVIS